MATCEKCEFDGMAMLKQISTLEVERDELKEKAEALMASINQGVADLYDATERLKPEV